MIEIGTLEIYKYVPKSLLPSKDIGELDIEEFLYYVALARVSSNMDSFVMQTAICNAFNPTE